MRSRWLPIAVGAVAWAAWGVLAQPAAKPTAPVAALSTPPPKVLGSAGCAARGCHGGPLTAATGDPRPPSAANACTHIHRHDPHPAAFRTLAGPRSAAMMVLLGGGDARTDVRCLACHVTPSLASAEPTPDVERLRSEGVGCDACHTKPGHATAEWLGPHKKGWSPGGLTDAFANRGLRWLGSAAERASTCAGCHVGAPADPEHGIPVRAVTHDLYAAGHPRLNFDFATFEAALPPHWSERTRKPDGSGSDAPVSRGPGFPVHEWFSGQLESARAGLELLARQAESEETWPELASFNCYSCHHDLTPTTDGWRQRRAARDRAANRRTQGSLTWNGTGLSDPIRELLRTDEAFVSLEANLSRAMAAGSDRAGIAAAARKLAERLDAIRAGHPFVDTDAKAGATLVAGLKLAERDLAVLDWDDLAQTYYALCAANRVRDRLNPNRTPDGVDASLAEAKAALHFAPESNGPTAFDPTRVAPHLKLAAEFLARDFAKR